MVFPHAGQYGPDGLANRNGRPLLATPFEVHPRGDEGLATLYSDRDRSDTVANPSATDSAGNVTVFAEPGAYDLICDGQVLPIVIAPDPEDLEPGEAGTTSLVRDDVFVGYGTKKKQWEGVPMTDPDSGITVSEFVYPGAGMASFFPGYGVLGCPTIFSDHVDQAFFSGSLFGGVGTYDGDTLVTLPEWSRPDSDVTLEWCNGFTGEFVKIDDNGFHRVGERVELSGVLGVDGTIKLAEGGITIPEWGDEEPDAFVFNFRFLGWQSAGLLQPAPPSDVGVYLAGGIIADTDLVGGDFTTVELLNGDGSSVFGPGLPREAIAGGVYLILTGANVARWLITESGPCVKLAEPSTQNCIVKVAAGNFTGTDFLPVEMLGAGTIIPDTGGRLTTTLDRFVPDNDLSDLVTQDDLTAGLSNKVTTEDVATAVSGLATTEYVDTAKSDAEQYADGADTALLMGIKFPGKQLYSGLWPDVDPDGVAQDIITTWQVPLINAANNSLDVGYINFVAETAITRLVAQAVCWTDDAVQADDSTLGPGASLRWAFPDSEGGTIVPFRVILCGNSSRRLQQMEATFVTVPGQAYRMQWLVDGGADSPGLHGWFYGAPAALATINIYSA